MKKLLLLLISLSICGCGVRPNSETNQFTSDEVLQEKAAQRRVKNTEIAQAVLVSISDLYREEHTQKGGSGYGNIGVIQSFGSLSNDKPIAESFMQLMRTISDRFMEKGFTLLVSTVCLRDVVTKGVPSQHGTTFKVTWQNGIGGPERLGYYYFRNEAEAVSISMPFTDGVTLFTWTILVNMHDRSSQSNIQFVDMQWGSSKMAIDSTQSWNMSIDAK